MAPPGLLLVYSDPGEKVAEEEFTDWYDNEHVPLRVEVPAFQSWHRWVAIDGQKPKWAASYDLTTYEATQVPPYSSLKDTRSEREKGIIAKLETLERRTYELYESSTPPPPPSALYDPTKPAPFTFFVGTEIAPELEDDLNGWYDKEHLGLLSTVPGFIRARRFVLKDWAKGGLQGETDQTPPPKYLAVYETTGLEWLASEQMKAAMATPWAVRVEKELKIFERRGFTLHRSWERKGSLL